jgi:hypothetical protein
LAKVKTGDELDAIESILASRGASQEHPAEEGAVYNATETEEYKAENGIRRTTKSPRRSRKRLARPRPRRSPRTPVR